ncbi:hypothetical protein ACI0FR_01587 [Paenochrobactrum sp. BZR 201-1]
MTMLAFAYKKSEVSGGVKRLNNKPCTAGMVTVSHMCRKIVGGHDGK